MITLFNYLLIFNIFAGGFVLFTVPFEFYIGYVFIILFVMAYLLRYRNMTINPYFLVFLISLTISSIFNVYCQNTTLFLMLKQAVGVAITGTAYYLLIKVNKYDVDRLFRIYLQMALIVAAIGVFQEISFLIGFKSGYDYSYIIPKWRAAPALMGMLKVNSIFEEASHFANALTPALFVSLMALLRNNCSYLNKKSAVMIILSIFLTFSAIAYLEFLFCLILISINIKKSALLLMASIIIIFIYMTYNYSSEIRLRVDDSIAVVTGSKKAADVNLSTYALASNAFVAYKSFLDNPFFGHGLGSHPISYNRYLIPGNSEGFWQGSVYGLNREDACSLFLRLASETGLFGIMAVLYFIFKFPIKNSDNKNLKMLNNGIFVMFLAHLFRQGHYFYDGLFFFVWLYYFTYKLNTKTE